MIFALWSESIALTTSSKMIKGKELILALARSIDKPKDLRCPSLNFIEASSVTAEPLI